MADLNPNESYDQARAAFWRNFLKVVGTEPRSAATIVGSSGITHPVLAIGADDTRKRLVVISDEHDARAAAMIQVDIQNTLPGVQVVVARPIAFALPMIARRLIESLGLTTITPEVFQRLGKLNEVEKARLNESMKFVFGSTINAFKNAPLDVLSQIHYALRQLTLHDVLKSALGFTRPDSQPLDLVKLCTVDPMAADREMGVCALPLFDLQESDWDLFRGERTEELIRRLRVLGIFQYFFPPPDQAALGIIDRANLKKDAIAQSVSRLPDIGHPLGEPELIPHFRTMTEAIETLKDMGLIVEGEITFELTPLGEKARGSVKLKTREGVISKLINKISVDGIIKIQNIFR
ncbi:MAG: hypothetical protein KGL11_14475 [Alphaproteobacteria bacterium]|nr:hypothetical protein [Alphaproteobacteria bacterium]